MQKIIEQNGLLQRYFEENSNLNNVSLIVSSLYIKNGYYTKVISDDVILVYQCSEKNNPLFIVSIAGLTNALSLKEVIDLYRNFEDNLKNKYHCNSLILISLKGYGTSELNLLRSLNMRFEDLNYLIELFDRGNANKNKSQTVELHAHNKYAFEQLVSLLKIHNKVTVIQATGTGKSFIMMKLLQENPNKNIIIVEPSNLIMEQIKSKYSGSLDNVYFISYQKLYKYKICELERINPDIILFDEMHRLGAKKWVMGYINISALNKNVKLIGFSATPIRTLDGFRDIREELFDNISTDELTLTDSIVREILPMPTYVSALYSIDDEILSKKKQLKNFNAEEVLKNNIQEKLNNLKLNWSNTFGVELILAKYIPKKLQNIKMIVFFEDHQHLNEMKDTVKNWFVKAFPKFSVEENVVSYYLRNTKVALDNFRNNTEKFKINLLYSVNLLNEGIHVGDITGVLLLRRTTSDIIYKQQIGRAIQVGNTSPIIFDFVNNFNCIKSIDFKMQLNDSLEKQNILRESLGLNILNDNFSIFIKDYTLPAYEIFKEIDSMVQNRWDYLYNRLVEYKLKHGNCRPSRKFDYELYYFAKVQRTLYQKGRLEKYKIDKLNSLGFYWDVNYELWNFKYQLLKEFKDKHGHCNVPYTYKSEHNLNYWVGTQRAAYRDGIISSDKIEKLNDLGFVWKLKETVWLRNFEELREFKNKYGHCDVPRLKEEFLFLGNWVHGQRILYNRGRLTNEKIALLTSIDFKWNAFDSRWDCYYQKLIDFKNEYGHCNVPSTFNDKKFSNWVRSQRELYLKAGMSKEKIELFNSIGFVWQPNQQSWLKKYNSLTKYKNEHGDFYIYNGDKKNSELILFVKGLLKNYKSGTLNEKKIQMLTSINFDFTKEYIIKEPNVLYKEKK